jgi:hypothetical protein
MLLKLEYVLLAANGFRLCAGGEFEKRQLKFSTNV